MPIKVPGVRKTEDTNDTAGRLFLAWTTRTERGLFDATTSEKSNELYKAV